MFFPSCVHFSFFFKNMFVYACFVFAIFLLFRYLSTKYLVSFAHSHGFQHFQKPIPFSPDIWSHFWYSLVTKKSPCSNFHFDRSHSYTYVSRFFFHLLTLFMFPLLCMYPPDVPSLFVHPPHCYSPFFVAKPFFLRGILSLLLLQNLVFLFSFLCHFLFSSLSVKPLQFFFSFLVSPFFFVAFSNLVLSNKSQAFAVTRPAHPPRRWDNFLNAAELKRRFQSHLITQQSTKLSEGDGSVKHQNVATIRCLKIEHWLWQLSKV